jgi:hypothetical protein
MPPAGSSRGKVAHGSILSDSFGGCRVKSQWQSTKLRDFLDEHTQRLLVIMTTNHLPNIDGSIVDRSDVFRVRGFEPEQAVAVAQRVLQRWGVAVADSDLLQLFERNLTGDETELSLRQIGRTVDKFVLQFGKTLKPQSVRTRLTVV